jgi:hypothetical protein
MDPSDPNLPFVESPVSVYRSARNGLLLPAACAARNAARPSREAEQFLMCRSIDTDPYCAIFGRGGIGRLASAHSPGVDWCV